MTENKRFTIDKDGRTILDNIDDSYCECVDGYEAKQYCDKLNELNDENKLHKERISLLSSLLDLADAIIDTSDNEKAKQVWDNKNEQIEKEWEEILNDKE